MEAQEGSSPVNGVKRPVDDQTNYSHENKKMKPDKSVSWTCSKVTTFNVKHVWKIDHFSSNMLDYGSSLKSSVFSKSEHDIKFRLHIRTSTQNTEELGVYVQCFPGDAISAKRVFLDFSLGLINQNGKTVKLLNQSCRVSANTMFAFGSDKFVKFSEISNKRKKLLPDNQLQIAFDAKVNYNRIDCGSNESFLTTSLTTGSFETDMNQLLLNNIHSDFDLIVDDKRLHLHKSILSAHSPYFNNMFKENPSITEYNLAGKDYLYHILRILYFMYTGEVVNFKEVTSHMVVYAKMFQMDEFYQYLQSCLLATIDHSNVIRRLIVAHVAGISVVKAKCVAFVKNNFNKVMSTTAWLSLTKECKELVIELNNEIANQC